MNNGDFYDAKIEGGVLYAKTQHGGWTEIARTRDPGKAKDDVCFHFGLKKSEIKSVE